ncbi:type VII secretion EssA family protein [Paenibacillus chungangensis]|uniref:Type VII secretion EssA family protein n=1 Tax=Paenibacillus chungangensis TaxID=696535 RepID=A0ABW3HQT3_9BACL
MKQLRLAAAALLLVILSGIVALPAHANMFERIKDIYDTPERLQELQNQYNDTKEQLEGQLKTQLEQLEAQRKQLEESRRQTEELLQSQAEMQRRNADYRQQNEALVAENQELMNRMQQAEENRKSLIRKVTWTAGILIGLIALYALAVRVWRFMVWRKQGRVGTTGRSSRRTGKGALLP